MSRLERAAVVRELLEEGLNGIQIAERLDLSRSYTYALIHDPDGSKDKARKAGYGRPCFEGCGRTTDGGNGRADAPLRCVECVRHRNDERNARIVEAWDKGMTENAVAEHLNIPADVVRGVIQTGRARGRQITLHRRRDRELWPLIEARRGEGATIREIAAEAGTTRESISQMVRQMRAAGIAVPNPNPQRGGRPMSNYSAQNAIDRDIEKTEERIAALETELAERRAYMDALKAARDAMASRLTSVAA